MIIVTGGAGFIGSNLLAGLAERRLGPLVACDGFGDGDKWRNIAKRDLAEILAPADLFDWLDEAGSKVQAIFHLGARSATTETDVDLLLELNTRYTLDLWHWCTANGVRFVHASSAATYGARESQFDDDGDPEALGELRPLNAYAWSKHLADRRIATLASNDGPAPPQWAGLKFFNVYGPNEYHKGPMRSMALQIFEQARDGGPVRLFRSNHDGYGDGEQRRDFVWVGDCVDMMLWLWDNPSVSGLFNCGSGAARSFNELAAAVIDAIGEPSTPIEYIDMPAALRGRYQSRTEARMDRARAAGFVSPATSLEDGVGQYVRDFLLAADPYR